MELVIENLSKTYPNGTHALKGINLRVPRGMFGLLGPNGAGKSTLMRTIATLQQADSGSINFNGIDVRSQPQLLKQQLGYLPQDFGLYPRIDAETLLDHFATLKGIHNPKERKETVDYLLQKTNLYEVRKKNLGTYSGGMRQRFGIAQALVGNPKLIIVDEPTAGLDPAERTRFHNLLSEIGENTVVILSTHIVEDVLNLCQDMAIICLGEVLVKGTPQDAVDKVQGRIWRKSIQKADLKQYQDAGLHLVATRLLGGKLNIYVYHEGAPDSGFSSVDATLEEVYFYQISTKMNINTL